MKLYLMGRGRAAAKRQALKNTKGKNRAAVLLAPFVFQSPENQRIA